MSEYVGGHDEINEVIEIKSRLDRIIDISRHWDDQMPMMAMEELGECIQAISKVERNYCIDRMMNDNYLAARKNLIEEIADVHISLMVLLWRYDIMPGDINKQIMTKTSMKK